MQQFEIGKRLQEVRNKYISSRKLSTLEFADLINESKFNISNYESGKANIPNRVLVELYKKGINPTWILTGEQSIYVNTINSAEAEEKEFNIHKFENNNFFNTDDYEIIVRAGNLLKSIVDKRNNLV